MLDILACPIDKHYPLELIQIDASEDTNVKELVIKEGVLFCSECSRFYPIIEEIPVMLPDDLRDREKDIQFLRKWEQKIPDKITKNGKPWHL
jgi:uncharacterized protein YbaR (Trm112 family)